MTCLFAVLDSDIHVSRRTCAGLHAPSTFSWTGIAGPGDVPAPTPDPVKPPGPPAPDPTPLPDSPEIPPLPEPHTPPVTDPDVPAPVIDPVPPPDQRPRAWFGIGALGSSCARF